MNFLVLIIAVVFKIVLSQQLEKQLPDFNATATTISRSTVHRYPYLISLLKKIRCINIAQYKYVIAACNPGLMPKFLTLRRQPIMDIERIVQVNFNPIVLGESMSIKVPH